MPNVYVEARPKGRSGGSSIENSESVLRYEACAPVIGSAPETQSSASFSVFELGAGSILGLGSFTSLSIITLTPQRAVPGLFEVQTRHRTAGSELVNPSRTSGHSALQNRMVVRSCSAAAPSTRRASGEAVRIAKSPHCSSIRFARPPRPKISCCHRPAQLCGCNVCGRNAAHLLLSASKVREKRSLAVARSDRWRKKVLLSAS